MMVAWSVAYSRACRTSGSSVGALVALTMMFHGMPVEATLYTLKVESDLMLWMSCGLILGASWISPVFKALNLVPGSARIRKMTVLICGGPVRRGVGPQL